MAAGAAACGGREPEAAPLIESIEQETIWRGRDGQGETDESASEQWGLPPRDRACPQERCIKP